MTYEYECSSCGHVMEVDRKVAQRDDPYDCPNCSEAMKRNEIQRTSFLLKGGGWAKDSYAKLQPKKENQG